MGLPKVVISISNNNLGRVNPTSDGVAGLLLTGVAIAAGAGVAGLALGVPRQLFGLKDAEALGIRSDATALANQAAWRQIRDFYSQAGEGSELWIQLCAATDNQAKRLDVNELAQARNLLEVAGGKIRLLGSSNWQADGYVPAATQGGLDKDVLDALPKAHALGQYYGGNSRPIRVLLDGRNWSGTPGDLTDLKTLTYNRVAISLAGNEVGKKHAAIGLLLGRLAGKPVQRNPGYVDDGPALADGAVLTDGAPRFYQDMAIWDALHDKGYIVLRQFPNRGGYFFSDDHTATADSDDFYSLANGRVIDKAAVIAHDTYLRNLLGEVPVQANGRIPAALIKTWQQQIENALNKLMVQTGNASNAFCVIDAAQDVIGTDTLVARLYVTPVGTLRRIEVPLALYNPAAV